MWRIVIVAAVLVLAAGSAFVATAGGGHGRWDLAGTEYGATGAGEWVCTFVPLDNALEHYSYTCDGIWDPTGGAFPVTKGTIWQGQCDRTGPNSFKCSQLAYGGSATYKIVLKYVTYETRERLRDGTLLYKLDSCFFGFWQDPFGDELPAYGCRYNIPQVTDFKRLPVRDAPVIPSP